jgi:VanZ family protein
VTVLVSLVVLFAPGSDVPGGVPVSDKLVHGLLFAVLAVTGRLARVPLRPLLMGLVGYAGLSEVLQAVLPIGRDGDARDALADVLGVVVGLAAIGLATRSRRR